jgi:hypothetical protein
VDLLLTAGVLLASAFAGIIGSMFGLGGGIIIIPLLTLGLGFEMKDAIGASLIGVIASSTGAAGRYVSEGLVNIRLGMLMEPATTVGSIAGAFLAVYLDQEILALAFAAVLLYSAYYMFKKPEVTVHSRREGFCRFLDSSYVDPQTGEKVEYGVHNLRRGLLASFAAGNMSGMLGVGGGIVKVPAMNVWMGVPMRAATSTSNFMIGVTAVAGASVLYVNGLVPPVLAATVALGVFAGASMGPRLVRHTAGRTLRRYFAIVLIAISALMVLEALGLGGA